MSKFNEPYSPLQLIRATGSECPKCGGVIGGMSDLCLDCDYDPSWYMDYAMGSIPWILGIVLFVAMCVRLAK